MVDFQAESLQHADVQVGKWGVVGLVECQVLAVFEASTAQQDGQVAVVVAAAVHVRSEQHHRPVEQVRVSFGCLFQLAKKVAVQLQMLAFDDCQLRLTCRPGESRQLDSTTLSNGPHEIRIIAVSNTPVETRSRVIIPVQIVN